jgi:hypothetical protein
MFCAWALFLIFTFASEVWQGEGMQMQEMAENISIPMDLRIWNRSNCTPKSLKYFRDKPYGDPCRMPLALTLQRKNKEPPTGIRENMSKHGKIFMARRIP